MQNDLNQLTISTLTKEELKTRFTKVQKDILDEQKKKQKAESKVALDTVHRILRRKQRQPRLHWPTSHFCQSKAITDVMNHFKSKAKDKTVYLFGGDETAVCHGVYVGTVSLPLLLLSLGC